MDVKTIIENRFQSQKLIQTARSGSPERIVFHFGAMQSQNYGQSLWAVGSRMTTPSEQAVKQAIDMVKLFVHGFCAEQFTCFQPKIITG